MRRRTAGLAGLADAAATAGQWLSDRAPYPHSQRRLLDLPVPLLSPRRLRGMLQPRPDEQIIEIGPGTGLQSLHVAPLLTAGSLTVIDVQQEMLDHVSRRAAGRGISLRLVRADATSLPFEDATFDAGYLVTVLGEIADRSGVLAELRRVLRPGGRLVVGEFADRHHVPLGKLVRLTNGSGLRYVRHIGAPSAYYAEFVAWTPTNTACSSV